MRTKTLLSVAAALAASAFMAQAQVYSVNVVGYVNSTAVGTNALGERQYTMLANPLDDGTNTIASLFADLPGTFASPSTVLAWDAGLQTYITANKLSATIWSPAANAATVVQPGNGVFVRTSTTSSGYNPTFVGEVLSGDMTNTFGIGYSLAGNQLPIAGTADAIGLSAAVPVNPLATANQLLKWNPATQGYLSFNRVSFGLGWTPSLPSLAVGEGFFVRNRGVAPFDWVQNYTP